PNSRRNWPPSWPPASRITRCWPSATQRTSSDWRPRSPANRSCRYPSSRATCTTCAACLLYTGSCSMSDRPLLPVEAALDAILAEATPLPFDEIPMADALGRYLAEPVVATLNLPPFTNSAMDGYAIQARDTPGDFAIVGESAAGAPFAGRVGSGEAVTIST